MNQTEQKAIEMIMQAAEMLGWQVAFDGQADEVSYMILGEPSVVDKIVEAIEE